jgi:hypothetical protein
LGLRVDVCQNVRLMSALPPKANIVQHGRHVRFVPKAHILRCDVTDIIGGDIENKEEG